MFVGRRRSGRMKPRLKAATKSARADWGDAKAGAWHAMTRGKRERACAATGLHPSLMADAE